MMLFTLLSLLVALSSSTPAPAEPQVTSTLTLTSTLATALTLSSSSCTGCVFLSSPASSIAPGSTVKTRFELLPGFSLGTAKVGYSGAKGETAGVVVTQYEVGTTPTVKSECKPTACACTAGAARNTTCTI
jgi:hypothetical protein